MTKVTITELGRGKETPYLKKIPSGRGIRGLTPAIKGHLVVTDPQSSSKTDPLMRASIEGEKLKRVALPQKQRLFIQKPKALPLPELLPENPKSTSPRMILPVSLRPKPNPERAPMKSPIPTSKIAPMSLAGTNFLEKRAPNTEVEDFNLLMKGLQVGLVNWSDIKLRPPVLHRLIERIENS